MRIEALKKELARVKSRIEAARCDHKKSKPDIYGPHDIILRSINALYEEEEQLKRKLLYARIDELEARLDALEYAKN